MTLREVIDSDASDVFLVQDDFAESVTYRAHQDFTEPAVVDRVITAVVIRQELTGYTENGGEIVTPVWEVNVANDATLGISSDELNLGGDKIYLSRRDGEDASWRTVVRLIQQDHGMLVLECR